MSKDNSGSVTGWIEELKTKNPDAQQKIWDRFVTRLENYANRILQQQGCRTIEAEDIASISFAKLFVRTPNDFRQLVNRNDLWKLLIVMTERRVIDEVRKEFSVKRGSRKTFLESDSRATNKDAGLDLGEVACDGNPTPDMEAIMSEELEYRLDSLGDNLLKTIAIYKMNDLRNQEIADRVGIGRRSVERKLTMIKQILDTTRV